MPLTKASYSMITGSPLNILDFGADSTGATDCSAVIATALAQAVSNVLYFPPGTYLINSPINITTNSTKLDFASGARSEEVV
jgi:polygalacturonase